MSPTDTEQILWPFFTTELWQSLLKISIYQQGGYLRIITGQKQMMQPENWEDVGLFVMLNRQKKPSDQGQPPCQVIFSSHPNATNLKSQEWRERKSFGINIVENHRSFHWAHWWNRYCFHHIVLKYPHLFENISYLIKDIEHFRVTGSFMLKPFISYLLLLMYDCSFKWNTFLWWIFFPPHSQCSEG